MDKGTFLPFPQDFSFGTATSSFQVEGPSGVRNSDWDMFLRDHPDIVTPSQVGPQWWEKGKAEGDIDTAASLGTNVLRLSLEWARIEPEEGKFNQEAVKRYHEIFDFLKAKNIKPTVTINHYTLPSWIAEKESWSNKYTVTAFERYTEFVVKEFGAGTREWITINEPGILVLAGYVVPVFPPHHLGLISALKARANMLEAHHRAYKIIKKHYPQSLVSMAFSFRWYIPEGKYNLLEHAYARLANYVDSLNYVDAVKKSMDFIGVNFYTGFYLDLNIVTILKNLRRPHGAPPILFGEKNKPGAYISDFLGPIVPDFFLILLRTLQKRYHMPIHITENGIADRADKYRSFYLLTHLVALWKAMDEGIKIPEYLVWSTVDNLEWLEGYRQEFGLIHVNPVTGERTLRKSAKLYEEIVKAKGIDTEKLITEYLPIDQQEKARKTIKELLA